jgi:hypothetical protein
MEKMLPLYRIVTCIVSSDGSVLCVPPYDHVVACSADLTAWPYDTHTCKMVVGSWTQTSDVINISVMEPGVRTEPKHTCISV